MFRRKNKITIISAKELKAKLDKDREVTLLDVRTEKEWQDTGVIPNSLLVSMENLVQELQNGTLDDILIKNEPIIIICKSGGRAEKVVDYLINNYKANALNLDGGVIAWNKIGGDFEPIGNWA